MLVDIRSLKDSALALESIKKNLCVGEITYLWQKKRSRGKVITLITLVGSKSHMKHIQVYQQFFPC